MSERERESNHSAAAAAFDSVASRPFALRLALTTNYRLISFFFAQTHKAGDFCVCSSPKERDRKKSRGKKGSTAAAAAAAAGAATTTRACVINR